MEKGKSSSKKDEVYAVIDLKSFYASCECVARGLDIFSTPLVVADPTRSINTIVMSSTPYLKEKYGIPNVCRVKSLPKVPELIFAQPRMAYYIEMSAKVVSIFLDFIDEEDIHVYSIDESFLHLSPYLSLYKTTPEGLCKMIQERIKNELGLVATCGIGPNMFLAKTCLDNEGKKKPPFLARWDKKDIKEKLWKISPITNVWGISSGIASRLEKMGIRSLEALANTDVELLEKEFGIIGHQLFDLSNGIDNTDIRKKYVPKENSLSLGQTLMKDYDGKGASLVLREMCDDLCFRLRLHESKCGLVSVGVAYSGGGGFSKQRALDVYSDDNDALYSVIRNIFNSLYNGEKIRGLYISFGKLIPFSSLQPNLFENYEETLEKRNLNLAIDNIHKIYGSNSVLRASSGLKDSTIKVRHGQIGGHKS